MTPAISTTTRVACELRGGSVISGEALAQRLGMSRAAVHKAVETLRRQGFSVDAVAGEGYALKGVPDRLTPEAVVPLLGAGTFGNGSYEHHDELPSTNTRAAELARAGAPHGTVVVAERQTAGKGRRGRTFESPAGGGVYLSVVLRPTLPPQHAFRLTLCGALAALDAVTEVGVKAQLKWPNDVYASGLKLCGVLTELGADMDRIHQAVVGVGLNVNTPEEAFPEELRATAGSVARVLGHPVDRVALCARLLEALGSWYKAALVDFPSVVARARKVSLTLGQNVRVLDGPQHITGMAEDLDEDGALLVRTAGGITRVVAGDVEGLGVPPVGSQPGPRR